MAETDKSKSIDNVAPASDLGISPNKVADVTHVRKMQAAETRIHKLVEYYRNEEKVAVSIAPFYAPYLGNVVRVSVNGIVVDVPADGNTYKINYTHANEIVRKMKRINEQRARQNRLSDVANNFETMPGELHL